jgi:SAM-dependent methyltransferase
VRSRSRVHRYGVDGSARDIRRRNEAWFPHYRPAHEVYIEAVQREMSAGDTVLHLGAGRDGLGVAGQLGASQVIRGELDLEGLAKNPNRVRVVLDAADLPLRSGSCHQVVCEHVFEHLEHPERMFAECHRVLRPGGALIFLCPNRFSYIALVGSVTPHRAHVWFKRLISASADEDTFPTYYRANSHRRIRSLARQVGFVVERVESFVGWPTYWEFSDLLHRLAVVAHWLLERGPSRFHVSLFGVLRKRAP